jgi:hypothetical protein
MKYMIFCDGLFVRFVGDAASALYMVNLANKGAGRSKYEMRVAEGV